jgi:hypothetical protein
VKRQAGLSKFEFAVVLAIFGVLAHILLDRLTALELETERLEVDLTVRHIHTGLKLAIGERLMRSEEQRIAELRDANPLDFLDLKVGPGKTAGAPGSWRYDAASRILAYRPRQPEAFGGRTSLTWRYVGRTDEAGRTVGLRLEPLK